MILDKGSYFIPELLNEKSRLFQQSWVKGLSCKSLLICFTEPYYKELLYVCDRDSPGV